MLMAVSALLAMRPMRRTPWQGFGAGMAIEDAMVLAALFRAIQSAEEIQALFQAYDDGAAASVSTDYRLEPPDGGHCVWPAC